MKFALMSLFVFGLSLNLQAAELNFTCKDIRQVAHQVQFSEASMIIDGKTTYTETVGYLPQDLFTAYAHFHTNQSAPADLLVWQLGDGTLEFILVNDGDNGGYLSNCSRL